VIVPDRASNTDQRDLSDLRLSAPNEKWEEERREWEGAGTGIACIDTGRSLRENGRLKTDRSGEEPVNDRNDSRLVVGGGGGEFSGRSRKKDLESGDEANGSIV